MKVIFQILDGGDGYVRDVSGWKHLPAVGDEVIVIGEECRVESISWDTDSWVVTILLESQSKEFRGSNDFADFSEESITNLRIFGWVTYDEWSRDNGLT